MGIKSWLSIPFAKYVVNQQRKWAQKPVMHQKRTFESLIVQGRETLFGEDHGFKHIRSVKEFQERVPLRDYEQLRPYIDRIRAGESDVLWKGRPIYFAKTSGTTSGSKYIPITKSSIPNHINSARNALLSYIRESENSSFVDGQMIFLSGSPELNMEGDIPTGRLSGIVNHHVPQYLRRNQKPSFEANCIEDWEAKLDKIIEETGEADMRLISGIPPWIQMYFDRLIEKYNRPISEIFPNLSLIVHGGVNFKPYSNKLFESIGKEIDAIETYPASEGFFAFQDSQNEEGLLLQLNSGIFFEFVPLEEIQNENPKRYCIEDVQLDKNYAIIISSNAGLWAYVIGDTVKFVSKSPYRIVVTGRVKHFISAFGEHVIAEEVEKAMNETVKKFPETEIVEFTVAPKINPEKGLSCHEWFISFSKQPNNISSFEKELNLQLCRLNSYYDDLIQGNILKNLEVAVLQPDAFIRFMKKNGKLGGQNKVPRLSNDRKFAEGLTEFALNQK
ncbi:MAG: GH3 auxin-responsive promoter family protein [Cytophagales bacterium]